MVPNPLFSIFVGGGLKDCRYFFSNHNKTKGYTFYPVVSFLCRMLFASVIISSKMAQNAFQLGKIK